MADQPRDRSDRDRSEKESSRRWSDPVRAMTRRWVADAPTPPTTPAARPSRSAVIDCALYVDGKRQPGDWRYDDALVAARRHRNAFVWLGLHEPDAPEMADVAEAYGLHELAVEDAVKAAQRPKLEQFGDVSFLVVRTARYVEHTELTENSEIVETGYVMLFIGACFVVSVRHGDAYKLSPIRADLESKEELLAHGPWAVAWAVTDRIVDTYLDVAAAVEEDIDRVEESVFSASGHGRIPRIYQLKRELVEFKRAVVPLQRPLYSLVSEQACDVPKEIRKYFRDVQDHVTRTVEQVNSYDDLLNSILQARLAQVTVEQNDAMRKIAAWAAIAAAQTTIAGIYGMNFRVMPELDWQYGYPAILTVMIAIALAMYWLLRRTGWL
jgi:magnesium transporter